MPYTSDSHEFVQLVKDNPKAKKILAEGDSWFSYPRRFFAFGAAANVVHVLGKKREYIIYSTASNGDEAIAMMSGEQKHAMMKRISANVYDFILFSGGGNDIVGRFDLDYFVSEKEHSMTAYDCINNQRLSRKLDQVEAAYEELIERVSQFSVNKNVKVISHTYDFVIPTKKGFALFDIFPVGESWMWPILMRRNITNPQDQRLVARTILEAFKDRLLAIQERYADRFRVVNTQGLLADNQWRNEIHPTPAGFKLVAREIANTLESFR